MRTSYLAVQGLAIGLTSCIAMAAPAVDGTVSGMDVYGPALAVQTVNTGFGNNQCEWNAAYGRNDGSKLRIAFTGNLQDNFNKFEVFIDSKAGGQSVYSSRGNDDTNRMNGMTFDSGFEADYHLIFRRGAGKFDVDIAHLQGGAGAFSSYQTLFGVGNTEGAASTGTGVNSNPIEVAYTNANTGGVVDGSNAANQAAALAVTTGLEFSISLSDLGFTNGNIRVFAFQNGDGHHYGSNQFLPGLQAPQGNLGGDGSGGFNGTFALNMNNYYPGAAEGWFTVVPAPGAATLLGLGGLVALRRRR
jgi:hypothetical protein